MDGTTILQIIVGVNIFVLGILVPILVRHARAHFKPEYHRDETTIELPEDVRAVLLEHAKERYQRLIERSADDLARDLFASGRQINSAIDKLGTSVIEAEVKRYREELDDLRRMTVESLHTASSEADARQRELHKLMERRKEELELELKADIAQQKSSLLTQIDTKLSDALGSFLTEALQHNVDLGAQGPYLMALLEEHKADFKREVDDGTPAAR